MLIYESEFVIGGEEKDPGFVIVNTTGRKIKLSLDLGDVTLKKGDEFTINAILLPWGSQQYEDGVVDLTTTPPNYEYDMVIDEATGEKYMDKNVLDVRENTLINPLKATADNDCEVIDSVFLPKLKTTNGETAEFTLTGGNDNVAVRIYGFNKLTSPKVQVKNEKGESVRKDAKFDKQYLEGKYGADPTLRRIIDWGKLIGIDET